MHAIDAHLDVLILPRAQDERPLATLNWLIEMLLQQSADGLRGKHVMRQCAREQLVAQQLLVVIRVLFVDHPSHISRCELVRPLLDQDLEHVGE